MMKKRWSVCGAVNLLVMAIVMVALLAGPACSGAAPGITSDPGNLALGADTSASDSGWGGGWNSNDIVDDVRTYDDWARGLAFWYDGWYQATINFGRQVTFNQVIQWYHGGFGNNEPSAYTLQYWSNSAGWTDIISTQDPHAYLKYPNATSDDWWQYWSVPYENTFAPVTTDKLRILNYPRTGSHTWLWEVEAYSTIPEPSSIVTIFGGLGAVLGARFRRRR